MRFGSAVDDADDSAIECRGDRTERDEAAGAERELKEPAGPADEEEPFAALMGYEVGAVARSVLVEAFAEFRLTLLPLYPSSECVWA